MFKCTACGYIHNGAEAPEKCPKCGAPQDKFEAVEDEAKGKVEKSRYTNELHMGMLGLLSEVQAMAAEGIDDNLDPNCVAVFKRAANDAEEIIQSIKAELAGHVSKGKWG